MRFLGYLVFEGPILWDLSHSDRLASLRPGLATSWEGVVTFADWSAKLR